MQAALKSRTTRVPPVEMRNSMGRRKPADILMTSVLAGPINRNHRTSTSHTARAQNTRRAKTLLSVCIDVILRVLRPSSSPSLVLAVDWRIPPLVLRNICFIARKDRVQQTISGEWMNFDWNTQTPQFVYDRVGRLYRCLMMSRNNSSTTAGMSSSIVDLAKGQPHTFLLCLPVSLANTKLHTDICIHLAL